MKYQYADHQPIDPKLRYRCRHIFTDGHRCGSPALRGQSLCFYHRSTRELPSTSTATRSAADVHFPMPRIDDRAGVQLAIHHVLARLASNDIDPKRAGLMLYGLQIASSNLPRHIQPASHAQLAAEPTAAHPDPIIEDYTHCPDLGPLAPLELLPEPIPAQPEPAQLQPTPAAAAQAAPAQPPTVAVDEHCSATVEHELVSAEASPVTAEDGYTFCQVGDTDQPASRYPDPSGSGLKASTHPDPSSPALPASRYPDPSGSGLPNTTVAEPPASRYPDPSSPALPASRYPDPSGSGLAAVEKAALAPGVSPDPAVWDPAFWERHAINYKGHDPHPRMAS